jgi:prepilin-type N-terminal cleavage/methylation domain-containing protein/prepilin-type processing-associated H-X9-DG protein
MVVIPPFLKTRAFTLIELLVVVAIIAILAAVAFPMASRMIAKSHTAKCGQNVSTLIRAIHAFAADNDGGLPYASNTRTPGAQNFLWWHKEIMPYLGYDWDKLIPNPSSPFTGTESWLPDVLRCPADKFWGKCLGIDPSYGINHNLCGTVETQGGGFPPKFWGPGIPNPPRTRLFTVPNPSKVILLADAGHIGEPTGHQGEDKGTTDPGVAWRIGLGGKTQPGHNFSARHDGYGTVGWLDGHVTLESRERLDELRDEKSPWASWLPPHMVP